jgi:hypothetical protein
MPAGAKSEQDRQPHKSKSYSAGDTLLKSSRDDAIARLKELRTALISAAVTGKIDVRDAAPA